VSTFEILAPNINVAEMPVGDIGKNVVNILLDDIESKGKTKGVKGKYSIVLPCTLFLNQ
jgi:LacI family transcriptional regulator